MRRLCLLFALPAALAAAAGFPDPPDTEKSPLPRMDAEQTARSMRLPEGFNAGVFAAEPDVRQPIGACFDSRGRLWVAENYTYAENPKRWDTNLRDRILIFEDKDGDGRSDARRVFWESGTYLTSIEHGFGGVWALCAPNLLFIPDRDGDDVPDGEPEVILDGWNYKTIGHNIVNGLRWGPDGWLYGRHGITDNSLVGAPGTPEAGRTRLNTAIWRLHPVTRRFEVVCHGGTNPWGFDWNDHGALFFTNTVIGHLWHAIPGAYYRRMFGSHLNPYVYEIIEQTADHFHWDTGAEKWSDLRDKPMSSKTDALGGGHAHVGGMIYLGDNWPAPYRDQIFTCNLHGNRINCDRIERLGCGYVGRHQPDFLFAQDRWFRGIDLMYGPDGGVFVLDWSDAGECHDNDGVHRSSGRIYKITYSEPKRIGPFDLTKSGNSDLVQYLMHPNDWWVRQARKVLQERAARGDDLGEVKRRLRTLYAAASDVPHRLRLMWALNAVGAAGEPWLASQLDDDNEHVRIAAIRLLGDLLDPQSSRPPAASTTAQFARMAGEDPSGLVRLHLASVMQRLPNRERWTIARNLAAHAGDAGDRQQPLMIWYGIEPAVPENPKAALDLISKTAIPTLRRLVARRLTEEIERQPEAVNELVAMLAREANGREDIVQGMAEALMGWSKAPKPAGWEAAATALSKIESEKLKSAVRGLSLVFGSGRAARELYEIVKDAEADANARRNALDSLLRNPTGELLPLLKPLVNDKVLAIEAIRGLANYDDASVPRWLINSWSRKEEAKSAIVDTLTSRPSYARALFDAIQAGSLPRSAILPHQARQIRNLGDRALTESLASVWGEVRESPEARKLEIAKWKDILSAKAIASANPAEGRLVFNQACAACHKLFGQGGAVAPDLTGADRGNVDFLLQNILDPNAILPNDFRLTIFKLKDGRVLAGVIAEQTEKTLTIQTAADRQLVERANIAESNTAAVSLMPEGLLPALGEDKARQLFAYLMSKNQVDLPR